jgi:Flp pilus assembly protein TadB
MNAAAVLALGWSLVVSATVARHRPQPLARAAELLPERRRARHFRAMPGPLAPKRPHVELPSPRALALTAVAALAVALVFVPAAFMVLAAVLLRPVVAQRRAARARAVAVERDVADVVALIGLAVSAGHNLTGALGAASARGDGPVALGLQGALARVGRGDRLADALESLPSSLGEAVRPVVAALVSCDRYGAPIGATLDRLAADVRIASRQRAEAAARRLPIRLLFPLVSCILPAFALLTVAPLIAGSLRGLRL